MTQQPPQSSRSRDERRRRASKAKVVAEAGECCACFALDGWCGVTGKTNLGCELKRKRIADSRTHNRTIALPHSTITQQRLSPEAFLAEYTPVRSYRVALAPSDPFLPCCAVLCCAVRSSVISRASFSSA